METNWKGTKEKGAYLIAEFIKGAFYYALIGSRESHETAQQNAQLFTDALHTIQECGLMPSQLLLAFPSKIEELQKIIKENAKMKEELQDKAKTNADLTVLLSE